MTEEALTEIHQSHHSQIPRHSRQPRYSRIPCGIPVNHDIPESYAAFLSTTTFPNPMRHSCQSRHSRERGNPDIAEQPTVYGLSSERNGTLYVDVTRN